MEQGNFSLFLFTYHPSPRPFNYQTVIFLVSIALLVDDNSVHLQIKNEQTDMGKNELYVLIAVFVLLTVIIVWFGAKCINDIRNRKKQQEKRRQEWQAKIRGQRQANG